MGGFCQEPVRTIRTTGRSKSCQEASRILAPQQNADVYIVSQNRYRVNLTALINTKVNSFAFINTTYTINVTKFLNIKAT